MKTASMPTRNNQARAIVRKYAISSSVGSVLPVPGADIVLDTWLAVRMLDEILAHFRLRRQDIDMMGVKQRAQVIQQIRRQGCQVVGKVLTTTLVMRIAGRHLTLRIPQRLSRYVPLIGQAVAASLSYTMMRALGKLIIEECELVARVATQSTTIQTKKRIAAMPRQLRTA